MKKILYICCIVIGAILWYIGSKQGTEFVSVRQLQDGVYLNAKGKVQKMDITIPKNAIESIENIPSKLNNYCLYNFQIESDTVLIIAGDNMSNIQGTVWVIARSKAPLLDACLSTYEDAHLEASLGAYVLFWAPSDFYLSGIWISLIGMVLLSWELLKSLVKNSKRQSEYGQRHVSVKGVNTNGHTGRTF